MKKLVIIGGGSALLVLSLIVGAFFAGPLLASAHGGLTAAPSASTTPTRKQYCEQFQQNLAKRLNTTVDVLQQARQGAAEDVLNQMVKDGKITQDQANKIKQHLAAHKQCSGFFLHHGHPAVKKFLYKYGADILTQLAQGLHLTPDALKTQLQSGKSLDEIAKAQGVSSTQLQTIATNALNAALDKAVKAGDITQEQADRFKQFLQKHPNFIQRILAHHSKNQQGK
jgi:polyhydroxyalkanoate synthesis regulator phasin